MIALWIPGTPAPGGSKKAFARRRKVNGEWVYTGGATVTDDSERSKPWKERVRTIARVHHKGPPLDGAIRCELRFVVANLKSHMGTGRNAGVRKASSPQWPIGKPDVLKLARSTEDALTGILWSDDARIVDEHITKDWGKQPGVIVIAQPATDAAGPWLDLAVRGIAVMGEPRL